MMRMPPASWGRPPMFCTTSSARLSAGSRCSEDRAHDVTSTPRTTDLILGAVAYDQKVVAIWDGFQEYFRTADLPFDYVLFSNYERQVEAHFRGHIHVAWNSPLAWLQTERIAVRLGRRAEAICMRDTDRDLRSVIVVRATDGINTIADLRGRIVAVGARDSPQATLIPLNHLADQGLHARPGLPGAGVRHAGRQAWRSHRR